MVEWATARGLAGGQWLGYQWEDPEIVELENCRYDVGLEISDDVEGSPSRSCRDSIGKSWRTLISSRSGGVLKQTLDRRRDTAAILDLYMQRC